MISDIFFQYESLVNQVIGEKEIINAMLSYKGGDKVTAIVSNSLAISRNTKNKQAAYNFIKIAISKIYKDHVIYLQEYQLIRKLQEI